MAQNTPLTPVEGLKRAQGFFEDPIPVESATVFRCPYPDCGVPAQHNWVTFDYGRVPSSPPSSRNINGIIVCAQCSNCSNEVIFWQGIMIWPNLSDAPPPSSDLPDNLISDYKEASNIYQNSPRGAAALLRLVIQKLCKHLETKSSDINRAIGELVENGKISVDIQRALDIVRVIGNEAVHPGVLDLRDDVKTVKSLFTIVNFIVEKTITDPKKLKSLYDSLPPEKLDGIEARDRKPAPS